MVFRIPLLALLLALPAIPAGAAVGPSLSVIGSEVRFDRRGDAGSMVRLEGDLLLGSRFAEFDPRTDPLYIRLGTVVLLDGPATPDRARVRATRDGWRIDLRRAPAHPARVTLRISTLNGMFTLKARGCDAAALQAAGPGGVPVLLVAAGEAYESSVDFQEHGARRWSYRRPPRSHGFPGGQDPGGITVLGRGEHSGIRTLRFEVVRDAAAWSTLWSAHAGGGTPPAVDFSREMVVGLFLGERPTGGYSVDLVRMVVPYTLYVGGWCPPCPDGINCPGAPCFGGDPVSGFLVDARETRPGTGCAVSQAVSYPYVLAKFPRVEGPGTYSYVLVTGGCP